MEHRLIWQEMSQAAFLEHGVGRTIVAAGVASGFSRLPFAGQLGDWSVPGESFMWVQFDDACLWLLGPTSDKQRYFFIRAARGEETT